MDEQEQLDNMESVAIVGMSCRFPGANNIDQFWENLIQGKEGISFFSKDELLEAGVSLQLVDHPGFVAAKGALRDAHMFDAAFFGINPREAQIMDPQHRVFLECAWEAFEHAGHNAEKFPGSVGVFAGSGLSYYLLMNLLPNEALIRSAGVYQVMLSNDKDFLPTRTSYKLDLKGPSVSICTACSSSLVAIESACQSLLSYQCDMALAGGAAIQSPLISGYVYEAEGIASPDGHCRPFDASARGTVLSSGVGTVVLRRYNDAIEDGDQIFAVIKGSATNNDGSDKVGYTAPSRNGQASVIAQALAAAEVDADSISYVEAHGTATVLGDPIEVAALTKAYRMQTNRNQFCGLGSVKSNLGHLDSAAGVAGLIKTTLALHKGQLPASLHFETPNPRIDWNNSPFYVVNKPQSWPETNKHPRRAGVSSFGIGGTNAHLILEEAPQLAVESHSRQYQLMLCSARSESALQCVRRNLLQHLQDNLELNLADVTYTLATGRKALSHRSFLVCNTLDNAIESLAAPLFTDAIADKDRDVTFMFPGEISQYDTVIPTLYEREIQFQDSVDVCINILAERYNCDVRSELFFNTSPTRLSVFICEYALATCLRSWGIQPKAVVGYGVGEYVAATLAGIFTLTDALTIVYQQKEIINTMKNGAMLKLSTSIDSAAELMTSELDFAAINSADEVIIAGSEEHIFALKKKLDTQCIAHSILQTRHALHSRAMSKMGEKLLPTLEKINLQTPTIPMISTVTGGWIMDTQATDPHYWANHIRRTIAFGTALETLTQKESSDTLLVEVGPGTMLSDLVQEFLGEDHALNTIPCLSPMEKNDAQASLLSGLGYLWAHGVNIDWSAFTSNEKRKKVSLPTYPFEHEPYWAPLLATQTSTQSEKTIAPVSESDLEQRSTLDQWFFQPGWKMDALPFTTSSFQSDFLLILEESEFCNQLRKALTSDGHRVISVQSGEHFVQENNQRFSLPLTKPAAWNNLFQILEKNGATPKHIIHGVGITQIISDTTNTNDQRLLDNTLDSLLYLLQALDRARLAYDRQLLVMADHIHEITTQETLTPAKSAIEGLVRVTYQEYPNLICRLLDIVIPEQSNTLFHSCIDQIKTELARPTEQLQFPTDLVVAYRGLRRWLPTYDHHPLPENAATPLREEGVYLIAGGLGGMGLVLAKHLASTYHARLILAGRSKFPPRQLWDQWLSIEEEHTKTHTTETLSSKIKTIKHLETLGATVEVISAELTDEQVFQTAVKNAEQKLGPVEGAIHCAGVAGGGLLQLKTAKMMQATLAAKSRGTEVLTNFAVQRQLKFVFLSSSLASFFGPFGQADYAAANAVMDCHAYKLRRLGVPAVAVNWDTWKESGMASRSSASAEINKMLQKSRNSGITNSEGCQIFERVITAKIPQIGVSVYPFQQRLNNDFSHLEEPSNNKPQEPESKQARPELTTAYAPATNEYEQSIVTIWEDILGYQPVGIFDNFFDLDGNSLVGIQMINRINHDLNIQLSVVDLYEGLTVTSLAKLISERSNAE